MLEFIVAVLSTSGYYYLGNQPSGLGSSFTIPAGTFSYLAVDFSDADGALQPGDRITGEWEEVYSFQFTYVGNHEGNVVVALDDDYYFFTPSEDPYPDGATITPDTTSTFVFCFAAGTAIATPSGKVAVEALKPGDLVMTTDGRAVPAIFIGRQTLAAIFVPEARSLVRVAAGALGDGLPRRDLVLTGDHALMLDGVLVNAGALVNGTSITRVPRDELPERFTVYHVETAAHDIILAEGVPAETYMEARGRERFDNHAEYVPPPGGDRRIEYPAPRVTAPRQLPARLRCLVTGSPLHDWSRRVA